MTRRRESGANDQDAENTGATATAADGTSRKPHAGEHPRGHPPPDNNVVLAGSALLEGIARGVGSRIAARSRPSSRSPEVSKPAARRPGSRQSPCPACKLTTRCPDRRGGLPSRPAPAAGHCGVLRLDREAVDEGWAPGSSASRSQLRRLVTARGRSWAPSPRPRSLAHPCWSNSWAGLPADAPRAGIPLGGLPGGPWMGLTAIHSALCRAI